MPRTTKDSEKEELNKKKTTTKKATTATKKTVSTKSTTTAKKKKVDEVKTAKKATKSKTKKEDKEKPTKGTTNITSSTAKKKTTAKASSENKKITKKTTTKSTVAAKKTTSAKTATKKETSTATTKKESTATAKKKTTTSTTRKKTSSKKLKENIVAEYYDLPYRYNETVVKILYQTPTILFVYWDISDYDREKYINQYGENFFNNTRPVLKINNLTKNYSFEVEINDFANSWYINVNDANCVYKVELSRKAINFVENLNSNYIHITSSNDIEFPNDHILLDELPDKIRFKNVKTNSVSIKDISTLHLVGINKIYNINEFYNKFYKDEIEENVISNPSSSSWR